MLGLFVQAPGSRLSLCLWLNADAASDSGRDGLAVKWACPIFATRNSDSAHYWDLAASGLSGVVNCISGGIPLVPRLARRLIALVQLLVGSLLRQGW